MANKALFSVGGSSGLVWGDFLNICQACDEIGYHGFYPSDHLMRIQEGHGPSDQRLEGLTVMAAMSGHTKNLRLGMLVLNNNLRHPVITAKMINTIDHASGGRAELGIGSGNIPREHAVHGITYPKFGERLDRLDEALSVIRALWTEEPATFHGKYYSIDEAPMMPKPVQQPHPPIIVGGLGERSMRVAAKHATDYNQITSLEEVRANIVKFQAICAETGRDPAELRYSVQLQLHLSDDKADVDAYIERLTAIYLDGASHSLSEKYPDLESQVRDSVLWGSIEDVKEQVGRWTGAGVTHFILTTPRPFDRSMMERFASAVMPAFA
jgi:alkanesulfonate monooxygenase SsuD/methylene tetrahydromethanopterin reductase-like flavin-dependent oxidoreductase (luciferase family)